MTTGKGNAFINYLQESYQELQKVTWPTRSQAVKLTLLVLGFCLATAVVIGVLDFVFSSGHEFLLNNAPVDSAVAPVAAPEFEVDDVTAVKADGESIPLTITKVADAPSAEAPSADSLPAQATPEAATQ